MSETVSNEVQNSRLYFLIGFMGSGKSMLSRGVSELIDVLTVEMDEEIESAAGMSINEIFATRGEEEFRLLEKEILHDIIARHRDSDVPVLISTGGGAPCFFDNMDVMNRTGTTIFLNLSAERLTGRLGSKSADRPLIKDKDLDEIREYISASLHKRMPFYIQARLQINMIYDDRDLNIEFLKDIIETGELSDPV